MFGRTELTKQEETRPALNKNTPTVVPVVDIYENEDEILLYADMPGVEKENISINIDNGKLELTGTRSITNSGTANWEEFNDVEYRRFFSVPQTIDINKVNAELKEGVLQLHLPKSEASKPRQVEIKAA